MTETYLIVNADDFGQTESINAGIIEAHTKGIVTSSSLMVRHPAAAQAAALASHYPELSVGLHFDLGEWACTEGEWRPLYTVVDDKDRTAVASELGTQLEAFRRLTGHDPTHLDSHQHVHRTQPAKEILTNVARQLSVPLRGASKIAYRGDFYGQTARGDPTPEMITVEALVRFLQSLPPGICELGCHPGLQDSSLDSMYTQERPIELATLCSPDVRAALTLCGIQLRNFMNLPYS